MRIIFRKAVEPTEVYQIRMLTKGGGIRSMDFQVEMMRRWPVDHQFDIRANFIVTEKFSLISLDLQCSIL